ncbi:efflux RND transporter periplasmic adaptor subunit [Catenovulum sp. 2E275]|uniref:efflux RND transporter periplasmic adaptor subunit n=1 Tax=Catenovulum sp. 2E275 TaxID=2980497 RepID=UPI0021D37FF5|nr:efflux RND transporter periplasmic adaptor subunit [Catenovulum sp. 2E275]MCU4676514.1 efflux RND transporter periplasmic adaptor subunit [Catenovulum sp. 2E275]
MKLIKFNPLFIKLLAALFAVVVAMPQPLLAHSDNQTQHDQDNHQNENKHKAESEEHDDDHDEHQAEIKLTDAVAKQAGVEFSQVQGGEIKQSVQLFGQVVLDPTQVSHVRARFTGIIDKVMANTGDTVKKGQVLAEIESNESLKIYRLKSPIAGVITARHANPGELTQQQILFTINNIDQIWVEFKVFPSQAAKVNQGQAVFIQSNNQTIRGSIKHILPAQEQKPYLIARALLDDLPQPIQPPNLYPGLMISAQVITHTETVALKVNNKAIQEIDGQPVVFIKQGQTFTPTPVTIGLKDQQYSQILSGLAAGQTYVSTNSYLLKAELGKSAAEHSH